MKSKLLILTLLIATLEQSALAYVTVDQATNSNYLRNEGFSSLTADTVNISKARAEGREYYTEQEVNYHKRTPVTRFFWRLYQYTDPAAEDYSFFHHDIKSVPVQSDL